MSEWIINILLVILGWGAGMLVNYLADILPDYQRLGTPVCMQCGKKQAWGNYLFWPRRCQQCGARRHGRVYWVEAIFVALSLLLWRMPPPDIGFGVGMVLTVYLGLVTVIDIEHRLILHVTSLAGAVLGLGIGVWLHGWRATLMGGVVGFASMLAFYVLGIGFIKLISRLRGPTDEVALGYGDVNLSGIMGLLLGWPGVFAGLIFTVLFAGAISLLYMLLMVILRRYRPNLALPFGPFLVASMVLLIFFKDTIYVTWRLF